MGLNPRVDITVNESLSLTPLSGTTVIAMMGTAKYGPTDSIVTATSFNDIISTFKEDEDDNTSIVKGAEIAFRNGATIMKVLRVSDAGGLEAFLALDGNTGAESGVITFTAKQKGTYGNGFTIDVDVQGSGRIVSIKNGDLIETFDNGGDANGYATNQAIVTAINNATTGSQWVTAAVKSGSETSNLIDATSGYTQLASGDNGADGITASDYTTAYDNLLATEDWDLLVIPSTSQTVEVEAADTFHSTMSAKIDTRVGTHKKYSMFLTGVDIDETIATIRARTTRSERVVLCAPSMKTDSRISDATLTLNGTYLACAMAGRLAGNDVESSPTRKTVSVNDLVFDTTNSKKYYNTLEIEQLLGVGACPASKIEGALKWARGVTRTSDLTSIYYEINVRRIVDYVQKQLQENLDSFLGEPNISRIRNGIAAYVDGLLQGYQNDEIITGFLATSVTEGDSPDTINVAMTIQPTFSTNFINVLVSVSRV